MTARIRPLVTAALLTGLALLAIPALAQVDPAPAPLCLYAFSKDLCTSELSGGTWGLPTCSGGGGTGCNNLVGLHATFRAPLTSSGGVCGEDPLNPAPCDEAPYFSGTLVVDAGVRTQRHTACKARGSWDGPFRLYNSAGVAYAAGDLVATLGVGTHRRACDSDSCSKDCERCHDARVISQTYDWQIGSEGTIKGRVGSGPYAGCTFTGSFQGDFQANGDSRGPQVPNDTWRFCGTLEGVLECPCPQ